MARQLSYGQSFYEEKASKGIFVLAAESRSFAGQCQDGKMTWPQGTARVVVSADQPAATKSLSPDCKDSCRAFARPSNRTLV